MREAGSGAIFPLLSVSCPSTSRRANTGFDSVPLPVAEVFYAEPCSLAAQLETWRNFSRAYGTRSFVPLYPALKRWATGKRPSGASFCCRVFHQARVGRVVDAVSTGAMEHLGKQWNARHTWAVEM